VDAALQAVSPAEMGTNKEGGYSRVISELARGTWHHSEQYAKPDRSGAWAAEATLAADARAQGRSRSDGRHHRASFIQNIRRGHYELGIEQLVTRRAAAAFSKLTLAI
jgi:transposase, IS6 family